MRCSQCGFVANVAGPFCPSCGAHTGVSLQPRELYQSQVPQPSPPYGRSLAKAGGFGQIFGLHPSIAFLTLVVDVMLFGGELATWGMILPLSIAAGLVLGVIAYKAQRKWYGDDKESALIKALILGFLTAIPTPLPALLYVPSGILGLVHNLRKK